MSVCRPKCGDGWRVGSEGDGTGCDDGNLVDGDGCSSICRVERIYVCSGVVRSTCVRVCGNSVVDVSAQEYCDRGVLGPGTGCLENCTV